VPASDANPAFFLKFKIDVHTTAIKDFNNDLKRHLDRRWRNIIDELQIRCEATMALYRIPPWSSCNRICQ
jgi:hypothetical protein